MAMFVTEPGWNGVFSRNQVTGAYLNGTRVAKVICDPGDSHPIGALATVLGSVSNGELVGYFVEWDVCPRIPVFVAGYKIAPAR